MRNIFDVSPFLAGFAVAIGALTQAVTRFFADRFVERYSPTLVSRVLLTTSLYLFRYLTVQARRWLIVQTKVIVFFHLIPNCSPNATMKSMDFFVWQG